MPTALFFAWPQRNFKKIPSNLADFNPNPRTFCKLSPGTKLRAASRAKVNRSAENSRPETGSYDTMNQKAVEVNSSSARSQARNPTADFMQQVILS